MILAGSSVVDGRYVRNGDSGGFPLYILEGGNADTDTIVNDGRWNITHDDGFGALETFYTQAAPDATIVPSDVINWVSDVGVDPPPTVTQVIEY